LSDFTGTLSRLLAELDLRYCLLSGPYTQTEELVSRLEMTIHPEDRARLPLLFQKLHEAGYSPVQCLPLAAYDCRYDFANSPDVGLQFFSLTIREAFPRGLLFVPEGELLARRQKRGNCWVASEEDEFCYLLSKASLEGVLPAPERVRLAQLAKALGAAQVESAGIRLFGHAWEQQMRVMCSDGTWEEMPKRLRGQLPRVSLRRFPLSLLAHLLLQFQCAVRRIFQPSGVYIVLLGPDGAGKSTLTNKFVELLRPLFDSHRILQWRPQILRPRPRYSPAFNPPHTHAPYGWARSVVHILAVVADYCVGYAALIGPLLTHNTMIVYDRDFHDVLVDRLRYRYGGPEWFLHAAIRLSPEPERMFLILDAEPEVILNRKNEVAPDELRRQRRAYVRLAANLPNSTVVFTNYDSAASTFAAISAVLTHLTNRFERRQRRVLARAARKATDGRRLATWLFLMRGLKSNSFVGRLIDPRAGWRSWIFKGCMAIADQGLISGSNFVLSVVLARYLGAKQYGAYALAFSTFVLLSLIHQALVLEPMTVFGPSIYRNVLRQYLGLLMRLQLGMAAIIVICGGLVGAASSLLKEPDYLTLAFVGMAIGSPCVLLFWFARRAFYLQLVPGRAVIGAIVYSALLWGGIVALYFGRVVSPFSVFLVMGICALLTSLLLLIRLRSETGERANAGTLALREVGEQHWRYGSWALAGCLFIWIPWNIFYSIVTHFSGLADAGNLRALLNLALPITSAYAAFTMLLLPYTARLGHEGSWESVKAQGWRMAGLFTLGSGAYWLLVCLFRNQVIHLFYAGHYADVAPLVPAVAVASILSAAAMGLTTAIRALRSPAVVSLIYFAASVVALLIGLPACWAWGLRGAILAILVSSITAFLAGAWMIRSRRLYERMSVPVPEQRTAAFSPIDR